MSCPTQSLSFQNVNMDENVNSMSHQTQEEEVQEETEDFKEKIIRKIKVRGFFT